MTTEERALRFKQMGYNHDVAEALAEREIDPKQVEDGLFTPDELFEHVCEWNGICGYSRMLANSLDNLREVHGKED